eukprot:scaffold3917_cov113-Isochrysis_galbana.AAC.9
MAWFSTRDSCCQHLCLPGDRHPGHRDFSRCSALDKTRQGARVGQSVCGVGEAGYGRGSDGRTYG